MEIDIQQIDCNHAADFMIVYVTRIEADAVEGLLQPLSSDGVLDVESKGRSYKLGKIGHYNVVCCKCKDPGTISPESVTLTVASALQDWPCIKGVIMPGICFGVKGDGEGGQHIGDVIASEKVFAYERQEKGEEIEYKKDRDSLFSASQKLLSVFEEANERWHYINLLGENTKFVKGTYISGNTRFTDENPIIELRSYYPQALAGDMEGHGLASVCKRNGIHWILVKGVSDFGIREEDNQERQKDAVMASLTALQNVLNTKPSGSMMSVLPNGPENFFFRGDLLNVNDIFFTQYRPEVEAYYLERQIDNILAKLIRTGCCWIYGESGVGKSVSLIRALQRNNIAYVLCDLSSYSQNPVEDIFRYVYGRICLFTGEKPVSGLVTFDEIEKEIFGVVMKHYANKELYVLIEEIPFDFGSGKFAHFFEKLNAMIISGALNLGNSRLQFVLSTIETPKPMLQQWQAKIVDKMKFIEMKRWTIEECEHLAEMITQKTCLKWSSDYPPQMFIERMNYSPAHIKTVLNNLVSIGVNQVDNDVVEMILMY